jgi:Ca2+:H+ antiporter
VLAGHCNAAARALVYVAFSNGTLVVFASAALRGHSLRLAQLALVGSLLCNLLVVTGAVLLAAAMRSRVTSFSAEAVGVHAALQLLAAAALFAVTTLVASGTAACPEDAPPERVCRSTLLLSRVVAAGLLLAYAAWLRFAHTTHAQLFAQEPAASAPAAAWGSAAACARLTLRGALCTALLSCALCAGVSVMLVDVLQRPAVARLGISHAFVGGIYVPLAVNAGELAAALAHAANGACGAGLHIAFTAAHQIALCVLPSAVLAATLRRTPFGLDVHAFEASTLLLAVLVVASVLADGRADWLRGTVLLCVYAVIAAAFNVHSVS